ncbi:uncharacterized protein LOC108923671 isoform X2 [Scleropages formosus]|nr:uncharacterized protein LOC108923671 isoform X2 [Scleropages formosus]
MGGVSVFAISFLLLPLVLLACTCCSSRKSRSSAVDTKQVPHAQHILQSADSAEAEGSGEDEGVTATKLQCQQMDLLGVQQGEELQRSVALAARRLPSLPRPSVSSAVYDIVEDMRDGRPPAEPRTALGKTSSYGTVYADLREMDEKSCGTGAVGDASGDVQNPAGEQDFPVYAIVKKGGVRQVQSELVL